MRKVYIQFIAALFSLTIMLLLLPSCNQKNNAGYDKEEEENDMYDSPGAAAEFEYRRNIDPSTGTVPNERMWKAVLETEALKNSSKNGSSSRVALAPLSWVERGSNSDAVGPSSGNPRPGNGVTSGRMRAIWVDLADATGKTVWVGGVDGGIWKTNDVTATFPTWNLVNDFLSNLAVTSICQDPTNSNTMYFSTGEAFLNGGAVNGNGVFKSTDHGVTWTLLPSTSALTRCSKILCDAAGNVYVSTIGIGIPLGLQRSSDGGNTWISINPFTTTSRIVDFEISSTGTMHVSGGLNSAAGVGGYKYTTNPAATTPVWLTPTTPFTFPSGGSSRTELACLGNVVYASLGQANAKIDSIAKSIDGGVNWTTTALTATNISDLQSGQAWYSQGLMVDPSDANTLIVGNLRLLKSTDGGLTFNKISEWVGTTGQYVHADIHNITWVDNGNKLLIGTDGGLFYSSDKGTTFKDKNTGLRLKQFNGVAIHPTLTNYFLCGAQDNGTHQFTNPGLSSSIEVLGGDGGVTGIDQDEPLYQAASYVYANFRRSSDGGASWISGGSSSTAGLFVNPYDYDNVANKVYSSDIGGQFMRWENPHSGFTFTSVTISDFAGGTISSVTSSALTANRVYFGLTNGKVIRVDNASQFGAVSTVLTPAAMPANVYVSCVAEASVSTQNLIATVANYGVNNIYSTTDGGTTWSACDGNLPDMPVYWAVYHPDADTKAYIATETGVWSTDLLNGASTIWTPEPTFPTIKTTMLKLRVSDHTLAAATYGRGLWTAIIPTSCQSVGISTQPTATTVCAGATATFTVTATGSATLNYQWQVSTTGTIGLFTNVGTNSATLTLTSVTTAMNNNVYHVVVTNNCPSTFTSSNVVLTVQSTVAPTVTSPVSYCQNATATALAANGTGLLWYGTNATGGTSSSTAPTPSTSTVGSLTYYVSQTVSGCESPRASITVNITAAPTAPGVTTPVTYCQNSTATALTASGTNLLWYGTNATGGTANSSAPTPSTTTLGNTIYYVSQSNGTCESPRASITVTIIASTPAPTVSTPVTYCQNATATALSATGTNLLWYGTNSTGGTGSSTAPTPSTSTAGSLTYYVSQTTSCGEGPRAGIVVNVAATPSAPSATSPVTYCQGVTATALSASGSNLLWYTVATGGTSSSSAPVPSTTTVSSTTYYVSQSTGSCESGRTAIVVNVNATPGAPGVTSPVAYCQGAPAVALSATGTNLLWYTIATGGTGVSVAPTPSTTTAGATTYYVSQTTNGCESNRTAIVVNVTALPSAPTVISPIPYCQGTTATILTATGTGLTWYSTQTGGSGSTTAPTPNTMIAGSITYYVAQTNSCGEGARAAIVVNITATPIAATNLNATNITETSALLNWTGSAGSFYSIEYKISTATTWIVAATGVTANSISITNLIRGGAYSFRVFSNCNTLGGGNISSVATFSTSSRNSTITNIQKGFGLKLTPNPVQTSGILDYIVPGNGTVGINIIDANGQSFKSLFNANQNAGQYALNISTQLNTLSKGTYIIKLTQNGNGISLKFIKN